MDGIILIHEVIHSLKTTRNLGMMIKMNITKSYDKLNCKHIREVLRDFGFQEEWIIWIMKLVSNHIFQFLLSGLSLVFSNSQEGGCKGTSCSPSSSSLWWKV